MIWPVRVPEAGFEGGDVSVRPYSPADAVELFEALRDERVWEHIPRQLPQDADELDGLVRGPAAGMQRAAFTVRQGGRVVGMTSLLFDASAPEGVEIGATQFDPAVWGTGVNSVVKALMIRELFTQNAQWIRFRTDERNGRSAAAILKLGATDLGVRQDTLVRRDGSVRSSRFFQLDRPLG